MDAYGGMYGYPPTGAYDATPGSHSHHHTPYNPMMGGMPVVPAGYPFPPCGQLIAASTVSEILDKPVGVKVGALLCLIHETPVSKD